MSAELEPGVLDKIRAGCIEAFEQMVWAYQSRVRVFLGGYVRDPQTADDLAQETFMQAFKSIERYNSEVPLHLWLFGIGRNLVLAHFRKEKNRQVRENKWGTAWEAIAMDLATEITEGMADKRARALRECLDELPPTSARLVREFYWEERRGETLAQQLGVTVNAVRHRLSRIREALRDCVARRIEAWAP